MKISERGIAEIKSHEALRLFAYRDPVGIPTIGFGHTSGVQMGQHITEAQAEEYLRNDVGLTELCVNNALRVPVLQHHFDAMVSLAFNIGCSAFSKSTLVQKINSGDFAGAADEFLRWNKATVGGSLIELEGLTTRRRREREMFLSAVPWPVTDHDEVPDAVGMPAPPKPAPPRPDQEPYAAPTPQEKPVVAPLIAIAGGFALELAKSLINGFAPLAKEKITKELARHASPEVSEQVASSLIQAAQAATGKADPIDAVAAARTNPTVMQTLEVDALAHIDKLMPVLERVQKWESDAWASEEASRAAAAARNAAHPNLNQDALLTKSIIAMMVGVIVILAALAAGLAAMDVDVQGIVGALLLLIGGVGAKFSTRYDYAYGSSRGSAAKDVMVEEMSRRKA